MAIEPTPPLQGQPARPSDMVRRLQIGVGGVLVVLLLVGLAGMIAKRAADQAVSDAAATGAVAAPAAAAPATDQPLVDLGVQPVAPDPGTAAAALQPSTSVPDLPNNPALAPAPKNGQ